MNIPNIFKKSIISAFILGLIVVAGSSVTMAQTSQFTSKYGYNMRNSVEVKKLQQFLKDYGYYAGPVTGNYLSMTKNAVALFQKINNVFPASGLFGPATRAVANALLAKSANISKVADNQASLSLIAPTSGSFETGQTQTVKWSSNNYRLSDVNVNLIRKVSDNPVRYELVRTISDNTKNDGNATWVPAATDVGTDLSIEIGCNLSATACQASNSVSSNLAVINSDRYSNTASAYQAIEAENNK